jgi:hypothetical protein
MGFYLQRAVMNPTRRRSIANYFASRLPKANSLALTPEQQQIASALETNGFAMMPQLLSASQIADVRSYLQDKECYDRWKPHFGRFLVQNVPPACHVAPYVDSVIVAAPHLLEAANHPSVLAVIQQVLGCKPTISNLGLWWSLTGHNKPEEAENYHRDVDEWHFIKLFVYLTDVTENSGPHKFMKGSHREPKLLPIRRYQDDEVHGAFGKENEITFVGKAGTCFLENTFGFHKGQLPISDNRLVFQAQYSLHPIGIYNYEPSPQLEKNAGLDRYINRLYSKA